MHNFPQTRRTIDLFVIALGIAALVLYVRMQSYWATPSFKTATSTTLTKITDSLMQSSGISGDTISILSRPNINASLTSAISDTLGTFLAKQYVDQFKLPSVTRVIYVQLKQNEEVNFHIGGNQNFSKQSKTNLNKHYLKVELSLDGDIIAVEKRATIELSHFPEDTASILTALLPYLPEKYSTGTILWTSEHAENGYSFIATVGDYPHHVEKVHLTAVMPNSQIQNNWLIGWERDFQPKHFIQIQEEKYSTFMGAVAVALVMCLLIFIGVFIAQMRKRAVSILFTLIASVCVTIYVVSVSLSFSGGLTLSAIILITISTFIFVGFLLGGMPLGGMISLALEQFPEKFYTLRRGINYPWKSYFTGRSILLGLSITMISSCVFPITYWLLSTLGKDQSLRTIVFNGSFFSLLQNPVVLLSAALLFVPLVSLAIGLIPPAISYRFLSPKWRFAGIVFGSILCFSLFLGVQGDPTYPIILQGVAVGVTYMVLFYYTDILAMAVVAVVNGIIFFLPLSSAYGEVQVVFYVILAGLGILGVVGYIQKPEKVHEQDYKPEYLYRIEEEKRLRDELNAAQVVQRRLLPAKMPIYPMLDVAATCIPAFEVGGDYYDFFPLDESHLGILIGDVSGKGMSAAFYITLAKGVIVSQIQQSLSPADILCKVNKLLYDTMERGKFISLIYGVINTSTMEFTYAQAGHNPILLLKNDGNSELLPARGLALGLDSGHIFNQATSNHSIHLDPGDSLILYTDGVTEAVNLSGDEFDVAGLIHSTTRKLTDSLSLLQGIITDVQTFIGKAKQHDDITLVVIKNNSQPFQIS